METDPRRGNDERPADERPAQGPPSEAGRSTPEQQAQEGDEGLGPVNEDATSEEARRAAEGRSGGDAG